VAWSAADSSMVRRMGSRKRLYLARVALSPAAKADSTACLRGRCDEFDATDEDARGLRGRGKNGEGKHGINEGARNDVQDPRVFVEPRGLPGSSMARASSAYKPCEMRTLSKVAQRESSEPSRAGGAKEA
jgi:hypothetical protein